MPVALLHYDDDDDDVWRGAVRRSRALFTFLSSVLNEALLLEWHRNTYTGKARVVGQKILVWHTWKEHEKHELFAIPRVVPQQENRVF